MTMATSIGCRFPKVEALSPWIGLRSELCNEDGQTNQCKNERDGKKQSPKIHLIPGEKMLIIQMKQIKQQRIRVTGVERFFCLGPCRIGLRQLPGGFTFNLFFQAL